MTKKLIPLLLVLLVVLSFCKKKNTDEPEEPAASFDKQGMLTSMADGLILPRYASCMLCLDSSIRAYTAFKISLSLEDFKTVKKRLHAAYLNYQYISLFELGPAEQQMARMHFNTFPPDTQQIKANIASGAYDLNAGVNTDAKGFPALDYLFFDVRKQEIDLPQTFASGKKQQYVSDVLADMKGRLSVIIEGWKSAYRGTFVSSLSTDIGSSTGFLVNQLNFELDFLKNYKIGIPLGKKTLGVVLPGSSEAYHEGQSLAYALASLKSIEDVYLGRLADGTNGLGFDDYLDHLNASYAGGTLNAAIIAQFDAARTKLSALSGRLSDQVKNDPAPVNEAYQELVKLIVLLKTDLPSSLGVVINYQDGDGD